MYVPRKSDSWRRLLCWKRRIHWRPKGNISRKLDLSQGNHKIGKIRIWQPFFFLSVKSFVKGRGGRERERYSTFFSEDRQVMLVGSYSVFYSSRKLGRAFYSISGSLYRYVDRIIFWYISFVILYMYSTWCTRHMFHRS